ncbi:MAG TPA: anti-sigma factor [Nitrospiraceae bacterium]
MTHEELEEAVPLYASGALERAERQALEGHLLSGCPSCHAALKEYQSVAALLPFALSPKQPSRSLKAKLMAARNLMPVAAETGPIEVAKSTLEPGEWMNHLFPPIAPVRSASLPWAVGIATLLLMGGGGYLAWNYVTQVTSDSIKLEQLSARLQEQSVKLASVQRELSARDRTLTQLNEDMRHRESDVVELKDQLIQREAELDELRNQATTNSRRGRTLQDELAALLRLPDIHAVSLAGSDVAKGAGGMLLFDARTQKVWLYAVNLPECPSGTTYQLWAITDKPSSVGTFHMDSGETAHMLVKRLPDFSRAKQFAISLEPSGGRPQPTGPVYLTGSL